MPFCANAQLNFPSSFYQRSGLRVWIYFYFAFFLRARCTYFSFFKMFRPRILHVFSPMVHICATVQTFCAFSQYFFLFRCAFSGLFLSSSWEGLLQYIDITNSAEQVRRQFYLSVICRVPIPSRCLPFKGNIIITSFLIFSKVSTVIFQVWSVLSVSLFTLLRQVHALTSPNTRFCANAGHYTVEAPGYSARNLILQYLGKWSTRTKALAAQKCFLAHMTRNSRSNVHKWFFLNEGSSH